MELRENIYRGWLFGTLAALSLVITCIATILAFLPSFEMPFVGGALYLIAGLVSTAMFLFWANLSGKSLKQNPTPSNAGLSMLPSYFLAALGAILYVMAFGSLLALILGFWMIFGDDAGIIGGLIIVMSVLFLALSITTGRQLVRRSGVFGQMVKAPARKSDTT
ncbi:MAG: hypothetical protein WBF53_07115 [Litorimonas sp.]